MNTTKSSLFLQDDHMLEGAGRQVMADLNQFFSKERLQQAATQDERSRLARELHDGVLQSLTGVVLQLEAASRLIGTDPVAARERLRGIQDLMAEEQRELRVWIEELQPCTRTSIATGADLAAALTKLRERAEWHWGLRVELSVDHDGTVPRMLGDEIHRLVREALTNAGRHARASLVRVNVELGVTGPLHIAVSDDGCGFPFRGRYDLAELTARGIGPRSLRDRVASLHGEFVLTSSLSGSQLQITLPRAEHTPRCATRKFNNALTC